MTNILLHSSREVKVKKVYIDKNAPEYPRGESNICPYCLNQNIKNNVRFMNINLNEALYKCEGENCMFPFKDFIYKNYTDNTIFKYVKVATNDNDTISPIITFKEIIPQISSEENSSTFTQASTAINIPTDTVEHDFSFENFNLDLLDETCILEKELNFCVDNNFSVDNIDIDFTVQDVINGSNLTDCQEVQNDQMTQSFDNRVFNNNFNEELSFIDDLLDSFPKEILNTESNKNVDSNKNSSELLIDKKVLKLQKCFERIKMNEAIVEPQTIQYRKKLKKKKRKIKRIKNVDLPEIEQSETIIEKKKIVPTIKLGYDGMIKNPLDFCLAIDRKTINEIINSDISTSTSTSKVKQKVNHNTALTQPTKISVTPIQVEEDNDIISGSDASILRNYITERLQKSVNPKVEKQLILNQYKNQELRMKIRKNALKKKIKIKKKESKKG